MTILRKLMIAGLFCALLIAGAEVQAQVGNLKKGVQNAQKQVEKPKPTQNNNATQAAPAQAQAEPAAASTDTKKASLNYYVNIATGNNGNDGLSPEQPLKNIDKALKVANDGDKIHVAEGVYSATFGVGYWEIEKAVELYGGYTKDFSAREPFQHLSLIQPPKDAFDKSANRNVWDMKKPLNGVVVDGFVFDGGEKTPYNTNPDPQKAGRCEGCETGMMLVGPGQKNPEGVMLVLYGNNHVVRNCVFVNSSFGGVRAKIGQAGSGNIEIANNIFVGNRMFGIEGFGLKGQKPVEGDIVIHHNTILFSWSRLKDLLDFGYGINVQNDATFRIHDNVIGLNISAGISSQRFNKDLYIDNNLFMGNKKKDFWFNPGSNANIQIDASEFGDVEIPSAKGNKNQNLNLPLNQAYFTGFLSAQYNENVDFDPNSQANQLRAAHGLNKQGTIQSSVSMFANKYPWQEALKLVGAAGQQGAQAFAGKSAL